jgi:hypothetical protein
MAFLCSIERCRRDTVQRPAGVRCWGCEKKSKVQPASRRACARAQRVAEATARQGFKVQNPEKHRRGEAASGEWLVDSGAGPLCCPVKPSQTKTMQQKLTKLSCLSPDVKSTKSTFDAFANLCAETSQAGYELRGFHAFPAQSARVGQAQSDQIKPEDQWLGLWLALTLPSPRGEGVCWGGAAFGGRGRRDGQSNSVRPSPTESNQRRRPDH